MPGRQQTDQSFLCRWTRVLQRSPKLPAFSQLNSENEIIFSATFNDIDLISSSLAIEVAACLARNRPVLLWLDDDFEILVALLACFKAGRTAVPVARAARHANRACAAIVADCDPGLVLCGNEEIAEVRASFPDKRVLGVGREPRRGDGIALPMAGPASPSSAAYLQYTSGSTRGPRGVRVSHANLAHNIAALEDRFELTADDSYCHWLPLYHDMGLVTTLTAFALGCPVYRIKPTHFARRPLMWLEAVGRSRATTTGAPNAALDLCAARFAGGSGGIDLSELRTLFTGAERVRPETVNRFRAAFAQAGLRGDAIAPCYGLAEATLIVSGRRLADTPAAGDVSCGGAVDATEILIVDAATRRLVPEGKSGEIWVRGPGVSKGYYRRDSGSDSAFGAIPRGRRRSYLRTGDVGRLLGGELYVRGRRRDMVIAEGRNIHLGDVEATVASAHPDLIGHACATWAKDGEDCLTILQEARCDRRHGEALAHILAGAVAETHGLVPGRVRIVRPGTIPRTTSGKIRRNLCGTLDGDHERSVIFDWPAPEPDGASRGPSDEGDPVERRLLTIVAEAVRRPPDRLDRHRQLLTLGLSSTRAAELIYRISADFGVDLDTSVLHDRSTIAGLADLVRSRRPTLGADVPAVVARGYRTEARASLAAAMAALALDQTYAKASGDELFLDDGTAVLDLVGGFGTTLFGHNHPKIVEAARAALAEARPINAQGSIRREAGTLAAAISGRLAERLGRRFATSLWSGGAEAVEAARRHSLLAYRARAAAWLRENDARIAERLRRYDADALSPAELSTQLAAQGVEIERPIETWREFGPLFARINRHRLARPPAFLAARRGFHGKTAGARDLTDAPDFGDGAGNPIERIDPDRPEELAEAIARQEVALLTLRDGAAPAVEPVSWCAIAAAFVEPLQSEGGVHPIGTAFAKALRRQSDRHGIPIVADEIQCGLGRCGSFTVSERIGLNPDYVLLGKALGGGVAKLSAMSAPAEPAFEAFARHHSSTFADDDISARAGLAALALYDEAGVAERAQRAGAKIKAALGRAMAAHPGVIADVRGLGCLIGVELAPPRRSQRRSGSLGNEIGLLSASYLLHRHGLRVLPTLSSPTVLRVEPSAFIDDEAIARIGTAFEDLCRIVGDDDPAPLVRHLCAAAPGDGPAPRAASPIVLPVPADEREEGARNVAFLSYLIDADDLAAVDPIFAGLAPDERTELLGGLHRQLEPRIFQRHVIRSRAGPAVNLTVIGLPVTSALIDSAIRRGDTAWLRERIVQGLACARSEGCEIAGLAGFLSIVTNNCLDVLDPDIGLTSGNTLTVASAFHSIRAACRTREIELADTRVAVVGAVGNIGSVLASLLAREAGRIDLVGRVANSPRLLSLAERLNRTRGRPLARAAAMTALAEADIVVSATSAPTPVIRAAHLGARTAIVCDVSVPGDLDPRLAQERPDVCLVHGGSLRLPEWRGRDYTVSSLAPDTVYACMAETALLGLDGHRGDYTVGAVVEADVQGLFERALHHGFSAAGPA